MKLIYLRLFALTLILITGLNSCKNFEEVKISTINSFKIKELNAKGIEAEITVTIDNPNPFAFKIYKSSIDIKYGNTNLGTAYLSKKVRIPAHSNKEHIFTLKSDFKGISLADIMALMDGKGKKLEFNGYVKAGRFIYRKKILINQKQVLNLTR